ncbi:MAG: thymidine phosphorylase [bacterium]
MSTRLPGEFIADKQAGRTHTPEQIRDFIRGFVEGEIPDYQMTAWLMAVYFRGMELDETAALTEAMIESGATIHFDGVNPLGDKHSTGGVGDKITLILAPLVAAAGIYVPTITGRGLGHTGGTLDKLESIPGMRTDLSVSELQSQVRDLGLAFGAQTKDIVPADQRMYALRDVTSTVRSFPLITSSILSKKVAEGIEAIVFDVKCGYGAFMQEEKDAWELARWLVKTASHFGLKSASLVTSMNHPLGKAVGNWLETDECLVALRGEGVRDDMHELTLALGGTLLALIGIDDSPVNGEKRLTDLWNSGKGFKTFRNAVIAQGGDPAALEKGANPHPAPSSIVLEADRNGWLHGINALEMGLAGVALGAGRKNAEEDIDFSAGFLIHPEMGDKVNKGDPLVTVLGASDSQCREVGERIRKAIDLRDDPMEIPPIIRGVVSEAGEEPWQEFRKRNLQKKKG